MSRRLPEVLSAGVSVSVTLLAASPVSFIYTRPVTVAPELLRIKFKSADGSETVKVRGTQPDASTVRIPGPEVSPSMRNRPSRAVVVVDELPASGLRDIW